MSSFTKANEPAATDGGRPKPEALKGHLLIVRVLEHRDDNPMGIKRKTGVNEDGTDREVPADCIVADVVDLDGVDENGQSQQEVYYDYIFLQAKLIAHFKTNVGNVLLGTLNQHPNVGDRKGAYYFQDQAGIPRIAAVGEDWVNRNPEFFGAMAPHTQSRKTALSNANSGGGSGNQARDNGQHSGSRGSQENWDAVHAAQNPQRSTLEQMRQAQGNGFENDEPPF
jgi:hypothetical protein